MARKEKGKKAVGDTAPPVDIFLRKAARLRVAGFSWDEISKEFKRKLDTVKHWPWRYPKEWATYMREAIDESLADIENKALKVTEEHLEAERIIAIGKRAKKIPDLKIRQKAATALLSHCRELRGTKLKLEGTDEPRSRLVLMIKEAKK